VGVEDTTLEDDPIAMLDSVESEDEGPRAVEGRKTGLAPGEELPLARLVHKSGFPVPVGFDGDLGLGSSTGLAITEATAPATSVNLLNQPPPEVRAGLMGLNGEV